MIFSARVLKKSHLHRTWVRSNFIAKDFHGVRFVKQKNGEFTADNLEADQIEKLQHLASVQISVVTEPEGIVVSVPADKPPVEEAPAIPLEVGITGVGKAKLRQGKVVVSSK
jgi:hypothetical protein